jgi:hypothetical protein
MHFFFLSEKQRALMKRRSIKNTLVSSVLPQMITVDHIQAVYSALYCVYTHTHTHTHTHIYIYIYLFIYLFMTSIAETTHNLLCENQKLFSCVALNNYMR